MKIKNFSQAEQFLYRQIPRGEKNKFPGQLGLDRAQFLLKSIGNPQEKIKVIHIAGTSGKGSTAYLTSQILTDLGLKTGLTLSPHLQDIRERVQINNQLISKQKFISYLNQLLEPIEKMAKSAYGAPTYFEILVALAFHTFYQEKVDYAVMETGLGGWYDGTNVVKNPKKIVILTKIGLDHTQVLGKTIGEIALQKAKIIHPGNIVFALRQKPAANKVFQKIAQEEKAHLVFIKKGVNFKNIKVNTQQTIFDFSYPPLKINQIKLGLLGTHQTENCSLALTIIYLLSKRDRFPLKIKKIRQALEKAHFPGRLEILKTNNKLVVVDGAHNPQKITSLTKTLKLLFPQKKLDFLIAFKKKKDYSQAFPKIIPLANKIYLTQFFKSKQDWISLAEEPVEMAKVLKKLKFNNFEITAKPQKIIKQKSTRPLVITGSLYLIAELYPFLLKKTKISTQKNRY